MTTLGWLGWRYIWAPPKGDEAAIIPYRIHAHGSPQLPYRNSFLNGNLRVRTMTQSRGQIDDRCFQLFPVFSTVQPGFLSLTMTGLPTREARPGRTE